MAIGTHTILNSIPFTKQTDPRQFPAYEKRDYPKMMTKVADEDDLKGWLERNRFQDDNGKDKYPGGRPIVGKSVVPYYLEHGEPVVVDDPAEERAFRDEHPEALNPEQVTADLVDENTSLKQKLEEMQARLARAEGREDKASDAEPIHSPTKATASVNPLQSLTKPKISDHKKTEFKKKLPAGM